jgi:hypothetical protein
MCVLFPCTRFTKLVPDARVAELADALDSKSSGLKTRAGSTPASSTKKAAPNFHFFAHDMHHTAMHVSKAE